MFKQPTVIMKIQRSIRFKKFIVTILKFALFIYAMQFVKLVLSFSIFSCLFLKALFF